MIVQLPCTWSNYMEQNYNSSFNNENCRLGWYYSVGNAQNRKYTTAMRFDTSQLAGISASRIYNPRLVMYFLLSSGSAFSVSIRRLLKPAAQGMTWTRYDGVYNWTSPGGESAGNDYSTEVIANTSLGGSELGWREFPISAEALVNVASNNSPIILFPPSSNPNSGSDCYVAITRKFASQTNLPYIEFDLLSGQQQVIIF